MVRELRDARILPIAYFAASHLGFEVRRAISEAVREKRVPQLRPSVEGELGDRLLAINAKHSVLPIVYERIAGAWPEIRDRAIQRDPQLDAYALDVGRNTVRPLVVDVEALFTLLKSILDVSERLVGTVERRVLRLDRQDQTPRQALLGLPGLDASERELLVEVRDHFVHDSAPWFDVVLSEGSLPDLAIRYSGKPDFESGTGYVLLSEVGALVRGVDRYIDAVEAHLVARIRERSTG